jgi:hypothetical protein
MSLQNKKVVFTGVFDERTDDDVVAAVEQLGAEVVDRVNRSVDVLLSGEDSDDELVRKAQAYGIPVLQQWQFDALVEGADLRELVDLTNHGPREFEKGATVKIVSGSEGVGMIGEIFWWGNSKFGSGMRAGIEGIDGEKYWVDEEHLGWPEDEIQKPSEGPALGKGVQANVVSGEHQGESGKIFWWGKSKYGDGMRAGIETDAGETIWADEDDLEPAE